MTHTTPTTRTVEHLDIEVACDLARPHVTCHVGELPAEWVVHVVQTCEHAPQFILICDHCLKRLLAPEMVVVAPCGGQTFAPASSWILTTERIRRRP